jgi:T5SS/PEP-CTERM-associated repeat protein
MVYALSACPIRAAITTTGDVAPAPPGAGGNVVGTFNVGNTGTGTMSIAGGTALTSTNQAFVGNGSNAVGIVTMSGLGSNWTLTTAGADLFVGNSGVGMVTISNLAKLTVPDNVTAGNAGGTGQGQINVTGLGSLLDIGNVAIVGGNGVGIVEVTNGGQVSADSTIVSNGSGEGRITVSGNLSRWQTIGNFTVGSSAGNSRGTVLVEDGGRLGVIGAATIGSTASATGVVEVTGPGSFWSTGSTVTVGDLGAGTVRVLDGGRILSGGTVTLASQAGSSGEVVVDGPNSLWTITGSLATGADDATITISNGGVIRTSVVPGFLAKSRIILDGGRLESTSAGNISNQGYLEGSGVIDAAGFNILGTTGQVYEGPGDHLFVTSAVSVGGHLDLNGGQLDTGTTVTVVVNGKADLRNGGTLRSGSTGLQIFNGGQFAVTAGQGDIFGAVSNSAGGEIAVVGDSIAVFHDAVTNSGTIAIAPGSQMVTLENLGFAAGSALSVQLAAVDSTAKPTEGFGQAVSSGQATLDGELSVSLMGGFQPTLGDTFQIVSAGGGRSGTFATENLPAASGFLDWDVVYTSNAVTLAVVPALAGDYNANGAVDAADYIVWRKMLGQNGIGLAADGSGNTVVDQEDYAVWRSNFGAVSGNGAGVATNVPEPGSLLLILMCFAGAWARGISTRRNSKRRALG